MTTLKTALNTTAACLIAVASFALAMPTSASDVTKQFEDETLVSVETTAGPTGFVAPRVNDFEVIPCGCDNNDCMND